MSFDLTQPPQCQPKASTQPFVFLSGPTNEIFVDLFQRPEQPRRIEAPIIVDPSSDFRIDKSHESFKVIVTVEVETPSFDLAAYLLGGRKPTKN